MSEFFSRFLADLLGRIEGPLNLRLLLQPLMAIAFALRDGRNDARLGRPPFGWTLVTDAAHRRFVLRDGAKSVLKVFVVAYVLDVIYQFLSFGGMRLLQGGTVAFLLAIVPYGLLRGPVNRLLSGKRRRGAAQ